MRPLPRPFVALALGVSMCGVLAPAGLGGPPPGKKVTMCHRTHGHDGTHFVTITVAASAVPAHLRQHDVVGRCPSPPTAPAPAADPTAPADPTPAGGQTPPPAEPAPNGDAPPPAQDPAPVDHGNGKSNGSGDGNGHGNGKANGHP